MFYICGGGLAGIKAGWVLSNLPKEARTNLVGSSAGALAAAGLAAGDLGGLIEILERAGWPSCSCHLRSELAKWIRGKVGETAEEESTEKDQNEKKNFNCKEVVTFASWRDNADLQPFACFAYDCNKSKPMLFSASTTPDYSVVDVLLAAASWPVMSPAGVALADGRVYCDAEFVINPLFLHRFLSPRRLVVVKGTSRSFAEACSPHAGLSWACSLAELYGRFMTEIAQPCNAMIARVPGPHPLASVFCQRTSLFFSESCLSCPLLPTTWILLSLVVFLIRQRSLLTLRSREEDLRAPCIASSSPVARDVGESESRGCVGDAVSREPTGRESYPAGNEPPRKRRRRRRNRKGVCIVPDTWQGSQVAICAHELEALSISESSGRLFVEKRASATS